MLIAPFIFDCPPLLVLYKGWPQAPGWANLSFLSGAKPGCMVWLITAFGLASELSRL